MHGELYSVSYNKLQWKRIWWVCMYNWIALLYKKQIQHCKSNIFQLKIPIICSWCCDIIFKLRHSIVLRGERRKSNTENNFLLLSFMKIPTDYIWKQMKLFSFTLMRSILGTHTHKHIYAYMYITPLCITLYFSF